jgi:pimeloyl-ACP methyl ester carboxylesterase
VKDGLVQDLGACRTAFAPMRDIPVCAGARDGTCLSAAQKSIISQVFLVTPTSAGEKVYTGFPFDPGLVQSGWAEWKFRSSLRTDRNPVSVGYIFSSPPVADLSMAKDSNKTAAYALNFDLNTDGAKIFATSGVYNQNSTSFMTAPNATQLDTLRNRGAKLLMIHGTADPIFSADDAQAWYRGLDENHHGRANEFARLFFVPGMGHSRGGPATDQYDALGALVDWVEQAAAPDRIIASVRGVGNPGGVNRELPADWTAKRSRPLCPYPLVARYQSGDPEVATSFQCRP